MALITVIGAGMMGSALAYPLRDNGHSVRIAGTPLDGEIIARLKADGYHLNLGRTLPGGIDYCDVSGIAGALEGADLVICGVSSFGLDWFMEAVIPLLKEGVPVLSVTKGMLDMPDGSMAVYPELFRAAAGKDIPFCAVGGPSTSYELADRDCTCVTFCSWDMDALRRIKPYFGTDYYHVSLSTDVRGVECAVALKNAYALAVSLAVGMSWAREGCEVEHYNSQAALFGQSVYEMQGLLTLCGERDSNIMLAAGDLYVTVFGGRTRKIGTLLGTGMGMEEALRTLSGVTLESVVITRRMARAVKVLKARGMLGQDDFPLLSHIGELVEGAAGLNIPWQKFERETEI